MKCLLATAFAKYLQLPLTAAWIFQSPCQSLTPRGYRTRRWALEPSLLDTCLASSIGLSSRQFVSSLGVGGRREGGWARGDVGERRRGGQPWIRLLIASLRGLLLRARYSVLCCRRQSGIRVTTACCHCMRFCSSRLGNKNRERRATWIRSR